MRTLSWVLALVLIVAGSWWLYTHSTARTVPVTGEVTRETDIDGNPIQPDGASATPDTPAGPPVAVTQPVSQSPAAALPSPALPAAAPKPAAASVTTPAPPTKPVASLPVADTLERSAPAGMAFGGSGKYQWYRQGNLTWRIDTRSGVTCIDFATMDEWTKPLVYSNGCRYRS